MASTLVSEYAPARIRGRVVVVLEAFWAVGWLLAAVIGYLVVPASANGWRWAFALGGPGGVRGRGALGAAGVGTVPGAGGPQREAEEAVRRFEASAGVESGPLAGRPGRRGRRPGPCAPVDRLWSPGCRTASLCG